MYSQKRCLDYLQLEKLKFIEGFSTIASPLTKLTRKEVRFVWLEV
jgi:hypothetical protein